VCDVLLKNVVLCGHFVICICPCLVRTDVTSIKHYLNAIKAKHSALNARKPLVGGRELRSQPFGLELRPFKPRVSVDRRVGRRLLLLSSLTTDHPTCKN